MSITCFITYEIEPSRLAGLRGVRPQRGKIIPRCGVDLIGYFAPHEGSLTTAYAVYNIDSLADYEAYRARLAGGPGGSREYSTSPVARSSSGVEDRIFLKRVTDVAAVAASQ